MENGIALTSEEKILVDNWAGEIAGALVINSMAIPLAPRDLAQQAFTMAMKLLEVRRDIYRDRQ